MREAELNVRLTYGSRMKLSSHITRDTPSLCVRMTSQNIKVLDKLPSRFSTCLELFISHNNIASLETIEQFHFLKRLMIEHNRITYLQDLLPLGKLPDLEELKLEGNPVCRWPLWDIFTIDLCKALRLLNGRAVRRYKDVSILGVEQQLLDALYFLEVSQSAAKEIKKLRKKTPDAVAKVIADEAAKLAKKEFQGMTRINSPTRDPEKYLEYLQKKLLKRFAHLGDLLPPEAAAKYKSLYEQMAKCGDNVDLFAEAAKMLAACGLRGIGLQSNEKVTDALKKMMGNVSDWLNMASVPSRNLFYQKPKLPTLNLQPEVYRPHLEIEECKEQETYERDYEPVLETKEVFEFEASKGNRTKGRLTDEELKSFQESMNGSDDEDAKRGLNFDKMLKQEMAESGSARERLLDSDYFSDASFEKEGPERRHRRRSELHDPYGPFVMSETSSPPSSARSRHDRRERRKTIEEELSSACIQELSSKPNSLVIVKFFKLWKNNYAHKIKQRTRRNLLAGSTSGSIPMLSDEPPTPLSARDKRPFPIPILPRDHGMKFLMGDPLGNMLSDTPFRKKRANISKSRSDWNPL